LPLPPGPKGFPIVGNLFDRPTRNAWLAYADWKSTYGSDVVSVNVGGHPLVVLNSTKAASELFERRSANYSDRPSFYMACELMQWKWDFGFTRYSDIWRLHRRTFHQYFNSNEIGAYEPVQWRASVAMLKQILRQPDDFRHLVQPKDDKFVQLVDKALQEAGWAMFQGNYLVDYFPILRFVPAWFPFASFKKEAEIAAKDSLKVLNAPFE
ncbi:cytochrome P450, partial [Hymenopellis radicata]